MSANYEDLAARAERGELAVKTGTVRRGDEARAHAREALMEATGTATLDDAIRLAVGRPPVGAPRGASPVVRTRVPQAIKDRLTLIAAREHRTESAIVREAVAAYVRAAALGVADAN